MNTTETETTETTVVTVLADRAAEATKELRKLAAKATRYGCPVTVEKSPVRVETREVTDWDGATRRVRVSVVDLTLSTAKVAVGGHEFLARIELGGEAGNIIACRPGVENLSERWRHVDGTCEHCNKLRKRTDVFVVRETATGIEKAVGRNCLADYLGINPAAVVSKFRWYAESRDCIAGGGWARIEHSTEGALALAATVIRLFGWNSKAAAEINHSRSTASYVGLVLATHRLDDHEIALVHRIKAEHTEADVETARKVIAWARGLNPKNDYLHNLKVVLSDDTFDAKHIGIAVSAVAAWHRELEFALRLTERRKSDAASAHVGKVGERLRGLKVTRETAKAFESAWGSGVFIRYRTEDGNLLVWRTSGGDGLEVGERVEIDATVKEHREYRGTLETAVRNVTVRALAT